MPRATPGNRTRQTEVSEVLRLMRHDREKKNSIKTRLLDSGLRSDGSQLPAIKLTNYEMEA